jgi:fructokinase
MKLAGIGELLWDMLPGGRQLGGAPANFAHHAHQMGAEAMVVSAVGEDLLGRGILDLLVERGISTAAVSIHPTLPTGKVLVEIAYDGQPCFTILEDVAWDGIPCNAAALDAARNADAVIFGTLAQRSEPSRNTIRELLAITRPDALRVFDINLRQHYHSTEIIEKGMIDGDVLKLNDVELAMLVPALGLSGNERDQLDQLAEKYGLALIALTRGGAGSLLAADGRFSEHPGIATEVVDTVGAGDSFTACLALGWLHRWDLDLINQRANEVAAFVCSRAGATPELPSGMRGWFPQMDGKTRGFPFPSAEISA